MTDTERDALFERVEDHARYLDSRGARENDAADLRALLSLARTAPVAPKGGDAQSHPVSRMATYDPAPGDPSSGVTAPVGGGWGTEREIEAMQVVQGLRFAALRTTWEQDDNATWEKPHPDKTLLERAASFVLVLIAAEPPVGGGWPSDEDVERAAMKIGSWVTYDDHGGPDTEVLVDLLPGTYDQAHDALTEIARAALLAASPPLSGLGDEPSAVSPAATEALATALRAAIGYMENARIDLATGATKATATRTIEGGIARARKALADYPPGGSSKITSPSSERGEG